MQPYTSMPMLAVLVAAHCVCLLAAAGVLASRRDRPQGWIHVGPGAMHGIGFLGCWTLAALISWVWLFVGSERHDAGQQMLFAWGLAVFFALGASVCGQQILRLNRTALACRGDVLRWRSQGAELSRCIDSVVAVRRSLWGAIQVRFSDGIVLAIDPNAGNAERLLNRIYDVLPPDGATS